MSWSPTALNVFTRCCPFAVKMYRESRDGEYEVLGNTAADFGIAVHAMLHAAGAARNKGEEPWGAIEATAVALAQKMPPAVVWEAKEHASDFVKWWTFPDKMQFEHGMAFDPNWKQVEWDSPARRLRMIFDVVGTSGYEHEVYGDMNLAHAQDYKTGWNVTEHELDSIQVDAYVTALEVIHRDGDGGHDVDGIRVDIIGTRFMRVFTKVWAFDDEEDMLDMRERRARVRFFMDAGERSLGAEEGPRPRVGLNCLLCNYSMQCEAFAKEADKIKVHALSPKAGIEEIAHFYAVADKLAGAAKGVLQERTEGTPVNVDGGSLGYEPSTKRVLKDVKCFAELWERATGVKLDEEASGFVRGLLAAMKPGVTQLDNVASAASAQLGHKGKGAAKQAEGERYCAEEPTTKWGWKALSAKERADVAVREANKARG